MSKAPLDKKQPQVPKALPGVRKVQAGGRYNSAGWVPPAEEEEEETQPEVTPTPEGYFLLGVSKQAHGIKGQLSFQLDTDDAKRYAKLEDVWLARTGQLPIRYKVVEWRLTGSNEALLQVKELSNRNGAEAMLPCELYLPNRLLPKLQGTQFYFHEVVGWKLMNVDNQEVGIIRQVMDAPAQPLLKVSVSGLPVLVPIVKEWVLEVDREGGRLKMDLPEGLIEVYTG
jgi:16S rRNA processing protein RimM